MNVTTDTSTVTPAQAPAVESAASVPPVPVAPQPVAARERIHVLPIVAMLVATLALAAAAWSWSDSRERIRDLKTELARRLAESGSEVSESRLLARNADDVMRQSSEKISRIENQMVSAQQQQLALDTLYKELAQGRDQWTLAEIEQILLTAAQQVQLAGNVKAAIIALEGADIRLLRLNKPQFTTLRRAIATDLSSLRAVPSFDEVGTSARIEAMVEQQASWPLASAQSSEAVPAPHATGNNIVQELWTELKHLVQLRRVEGNEAVLLPPNQAYFLRENLRLRLLSARLALLSQDQAGFKADLRAALDMLTRYFNTRDAGVVAATREIKRLAELQIVSKLPGIDASLAALDAYKENH
ncbi:MAG: heme biosynthesis operon protein HemX [Sulfuriferula multivorans]|uniref:Heme biosynthesis operon protein HemX n=1 Tax=Sulfuriferula multivorans TaxID=1559896 RepID=A0A7C9P3I3_9PROT|nr:heme biosynthesis operon protein HemX [Sulfuriferula multivorans]